MSCPRGCSCNQLLMQTQFLHTSGSDIVEIRGSVAWIQTVATVFADLRINAPASSVSATQINLRVLLGSAFVVCWCTFEGTFELHSRFAGSQGGKHLQLILIRLTLHCMQLIIPHRSLADLFGCTPHASSRPEDPATDYMNNPGGGARGALFAVTRSKPRSPTHRGSARSLHARARISRIFRRPAHLDQMMLYLSTRHACGDALGLISLHARASYAAR